MKRISRNIKRYQFSLPGVMLEVNILSKVFDYSFIENKVYTHIPKVECVKDEIKAIIYHSKRFRLRFWDIVFTQMF